ncbi:MAG: ABC transporter ATP-binding protein [Ornithinimicrobium sp.]|uniref:ABC transporter ATP-binding protein n=1 Tax=Ornithinimicrobium sp. TaxID=1977084 RepID=UPI003D9AED7E
MRADLTVRRGDFTLTADLDFAPGTVTAVLGPNGSGKSTLLLALAGLVPLTSGTIRRAQHTAYPPGSTWDDVTQQVALPSRERGVGLVLAEPLLFPHLTLRDNVAFGLRSRGTDRHTARARAVQELHRVGLAELGDRRPPTLSTGQAARAALARALATDPDLLLLDEPLSALDPATRSRTRADLHHRLQDFPGATVLVTHDPLDALTLADWLVFLEHGRVVQVDTPGAAIAQPRSPYVARIVGLNLLRGRARVGRQVSVDLDGATIVTAEDPGSVAYGAALWVAVDPAAVALYDAPAQGSTRNTWPVTVLEVTVSGQRARVGLDGPVPLIAEVTTGAVAELGLRRGRALWAGVKATEVRTYPA